MTVTPTLGTPQHHHHPTTPGNPPPTPPPPPWAPPPQDVVSNPTREGRSLRRQVLKGAVMVFVTAGYSGKRFIFEKAKELGVRSVVLDGPDRCGVCVCGGGCVCVCVC